MKRVDIGLLGCGTVGRGFVQLVNRERARVRNRYGIDLSIMRIAVRDLNKPRPGVDQRLLTTSTLDAIQAGEIVVEAIGGVELPRSLVRTAIALGRDVVTANKALLAESGPEIFAKAAARGVAIGFEASVCGGIPVIRALQRGLAGDSIESVTGILNGTCNFVLTRMEDGTSFEAALRLAQERGFAEADPSLEGCQVNGYVLGRARPTSSSRTSPRCALAIVGQVELRHSLTFMALLSHQEVGDSPNILRKVVEQGLADGVFVAT